MNERAKTLKTLFDKKVLSNSVERHKLPNFPIVKFLFENDILDMLVFLVLRSYSEIKKIEIEEDEPADFVDTI